jgi:two-component system response regulator RegA
MPDPTLLLIDDDPAFLAVLTRLCKRHGFQVLTAHDGAGALALAHRQPVTHAVVDLKLGHDSGLGLLAPLRSLLPAAVIIVLTGYASIPTTVEAIKRGADNYLTKPVDGDLLLTALRGTAPPSSLTVDEPMSLRRLEWEHIQRVLDEHAGNVTLAARALGLHRRTLQRKLAKKPVHR